MVYWALPSQSSWLTFSTRVSGPVPMLVVAGTGALKEPTFCGPDEDRARVLLASVRPLRLTWSTKRLRSVAGVPPQASFRKLGDAQKLRRHLWWPWADGVVPFRVEGVGVEVEGCHLVVRDLD